MDPTTILLFGAALAGFCFGYAIGVVRGIAAGRG